MPANVRIIHRAGRYNQMPRGDCRHSSCPWPDCRAAFASVFMVVNHSCRMSGPVDILTIPKTTTVDFLRVPVPRPILSVIVPVYNESATIGQVLDSIIEEPTCKEVLIVDDGSTDESGEIVRRWIEPTSTRSFPAHVRGVTLSQHSKNQGKGMAIRTGLKAANGEFVIVQDADLELHPQEYSRLLQPAVDGIADLVIGCRVATRTIPWMLPHRLGIAALNLAVWLLYGIRLKDEACCFKLIRTVNLRSMELDCRRFEFCPEVVAKAIRLGLRFAEVPVAYTPRGISAGKKLRLWDGLEAMRTLWRYRHWQRREAVPDCLPISAQPADADFPVPELCAEDDEPATSG
jgi:Glycosyl transferase family 2